jgi:Carboxypeptidase regulatory-like domain
LAARLHKTAFVTASRGCAWRYWVAAFLFVVAAAGCRRGVPVVDVGPKPPVALGTITGIVRGPEGTSAVVGRSVEVVNVATGEKQSVTTGENGGFTIKLPAGKYRLDLPLRDGETIVKRPGIVDLGRGDIDSHIEFVVASVRLTRPHVPAYRMNNGLGSPIA